jgi:hypothetical protein
MDRDLDELEQAASQASADPWDDPSPRMLEYLAELDLSDDDLELLLGLSPGLSWADIKENGAALFFRLRQRVSGLVCADAKLKDSVTKAVNAGADAAFVALAGVIGLSPQTIAAAALKPLATALVVAGAGRLCAATGHGSDPAGTVPEPPV